MQNIEYRMKNYVNVIPNFQFYISLRLKRDEES